MSNGFRKQPMGVFDMLTFKTAWYHRGFAIMQAYEVKEEIDGVYATGKWFIGDPMGEEWYEYSDDYYDDEGNGPREHHGQEIIKIMNLNPRYRTGFKYRREAAALIDLAWEVAGPVKPISDIL